MFNRFQIVESSCSSWPLKFDPHHKGSHHSTNQCVFQCCALLLTVAIRVHNLRFSFQSEGSYEPAVPDHGAACAGHPWILLLPQLWPLALPAEDAPPRTDQAALLAATTAWEGWWEVCVEHSPAEGSGGSAWAEEIRCTYDPWLCVHQGMHH